MTAGVWSYLTDPANWTGSTGILVRAWAQLRISIVATAIAAALSIPLAVWLGHRRLLPGLSIGATNLGRAIPSFAIIALVLPISISFGFGLGFWPTCVALVVLGIPPMFTSTYAGVAATPAATIEAANAMGMTGTQVLRRVELPLATPLMLTGIRISAVQIVATASLGALVGFQCLGSFVIEGLAQPTRARDRLLTGAILIAALAMAIDAMIGFAERRSVPWRKQIR